MSIRVSPIVEPEYNGVTLTAWCYKWWTSDQPEQDQAALAIREIGTNAVPFLIDKLHHDRDPTSLETCFYKLIEGVPGLGTNLQARLADRHSRDRYTTIAFSILGHQAALATNDLWQLVNESKIERVCDDALTALVYLGDDGFPYVAAAFAKTNLPACTNSLLLLGSQWDPSTNRAALVPQIIRLSSNTNADVAISATSVLGNFPREVEVTLPALTNALACSNWRVRVAAVSSLGNLFERKYLESALYDSNNAVRKAAIDELNKMPESVMTQELIRRSAAAR